MGAGASTNHKERDQQILLYSSRENKEIKMKSWFSFLYARYLPTIVVERFSGLDSKPLIDAEKQFFPAACAFVDISGFTKLSEKLSHDYGVNGAEMLNKYISGYFEQLVKVILDWGGDIIKFAGDAMLVVWRNSILNLDDVAVDEIDFLSNPDIEAPNNEDLSTLLLRAVGCNLHLIQTLNHFSPTDGIVLQLHTGIGVGELAGLFVGGVQNNWEFFVAGPPIQQMSDAGEEAKSGEVVISADAYALITDRVKGKLKPSGNFDVTAIINPPTIYSRKPLSIPQHLEECLLNFIPKLVRRRVEAGQSASWLNEYRRVFIMFVKLPAIDYSDPGVLSMLQNAVCVVQSSIFHFEGTIARLLADDKGTRFKIAFGMPTNSHEDDVERVVLAALDIQQKLNALPTPTASSIGIACGTLFCGEAGSTQRCEYTAVGYKVNLAARLMQAASGDILVDQITFDGARARDVEFEILAPIRVKGMAEPVPIYRPLGKTDHDIGFEDSNGVDAGRKTLSKNASSLAKISILTNKKVEVKFIGRKHERKVIYEGFRRVQKENSVSCILIDGEGGIGKTSLVVNAISMADYLGLDFLVGHATLLERSTPFFAFRSIFEQLLELKSGNIPARTNEVASMLSDYEEPDVRCLLNRILNFQFSESEYTKKMSDDTRSKTTRSLMLSLFTHKSAGKKFVVVLEDLCWLDSASWGLLFEMIRALNNVCILLTTRPFQLPLPPDYIHLLRFPCVSCLNLELLDRQDSMQLVSSKLKIRDIPLFLQSFIFQKAKGHPLYIQEVLQTLVNNKMIDVKNGECVVSETFNESDLSKFPDSVEDVIVDRIDNLPPGPELTVKVCAVIGKEFTVRLLADVHPTAPSTVELREHLKYLEESGFIQQEGLLPNTKDISFSFKNGFFQEVSYNLLLLAQRKQIHRNIAEFYLQNYPEPELSIFYALMAYHYEKAELWWFALEYSEKAAGQGARVHSNGEICMYYRTAIRLLRKFPLDGPVPGPTAAKESDKVSGAGTKSIGYRRKSSLCYSLNPADMFLTKGIDSPSRENSVEKADNSSTTIVEEDPSPPPNATIADSDMVIAPNLRNSSQKDTSQFRPDNVMIGHSISLVESQDPAPPAVITKPLLLPPAITSGFALMASPGYHDVNQNDGTASVNGFSPPPFKIIKNADALGSDVKSTAITPLRRIKSSEGISSVKSTGSARSDSKVEELTRSKRGAMNPAFKEKEGSQQPGIRSMLSLRGHTPLTGDAPSVSELIRKADTVDLSILSDGTKEPSMSRAKTIQFNKGSLTNNDGEQTIRKRLEMCHLNLAEALFSSGRYSEATTNFYLALELCEEVFPPQYKSAYLLALTLKLQWKLFFKTKEIFSSEPFSLIRKCKLLLRYAISELYEATAVSIVNGTFAVYRAIELAGQFDDCFVHSYAYSQAAYFTLLNGDYDLSQKQFQFGNLILLNKEGDMNGMEPAICRMRLAKYCVSIGDMEQARLFAEEAKYFILFECYFKSRVAFINALSHRKYRECMYLLSMLDYLEGKFDSALNTLEELLDSAVEDDDIHMECEAHKWLVVIKLALNPTAESVTRHLDIARAVFKDLGKSDFALDICTATRDFYRTLDSQPLVELFETIDMSINNPGSVSMPPPFALSDKKVPIITDWTHTLDFVLAISLLMDAAALCSSDSYARRHALLSRAKKLLVYLGDLSEIFCLLRIYWKWLSGRYCWMLCNMPLPFMSNTLNSSNSLFHRNSFQKSLNPISISKRSAAFREDALKFLSEALKEAAKLDLSYISGCVCYNLFEIELLLPTFTTVDTFNLFSCFGGNVLDVFERDEPPSPRSKMDVSYRKSTTKASRIDSPRVNESELNTLQTFVVEDGPHKIHYDKAKFAFWLSKVQYFRHPSFPLLYSTDSELFESYGLGDPFPSELDKLIVGTGKTERTRSVDTNTVKRASTWASKEVSVKRSNTGVNSNNTVEVAESIVSQSENSDAITTGSFMSDQKQRSNPTTPRQKKREIPVLSNSVPQSRTTNSFFTKQVDVSAESTFSDQVNMTPVNSLPQKRNSQTDETLVNQTTSTSFTNKRASLSFLGNFSPIGKGRSFKANRGSALFESIENKQAIMSHEEKVAATLKVVLSPNSILAKNKGFFKVMDSPGLNTLNHSATTPDSSNRFISVDTSPVAPTISKAKSFASNNSNGLILKPRNVSDISTRFSALDLAPAVSSKNDTIYEPKSFIESTKLSDISNPNSNRDSSSNEGPASELKVLPKPLLLPGTAGTASEKHSVNFSLDLVDSFSKKSKSPLPQSDKPVSILSRGKSYNPPSNKKSSGGKQKV